MFETLKEKLILDESKKISENSLQLMCEDMSLDESIQDMLLEGWDPETAPDEELDELEKEIVNDELDSDLDGELDAEEDLDDESYLAEEMKDIEAFVGQEGPAEYADIDLESSLGNDFADSEGPYSYQASDIDLDIL